MLQGMPRMIQMMGCDYAMSKHDGLVIRVKKYFAGVDVLLARNVQYLNFIAAGHAQSIVDIAYMELLATLLYASRE